MTMAQSTTTAPLATAPGTGLDLGHGWRPRRFGWLRDVTRDRSSLAGLAILVAVTLAAIFAPLLAPYDPTALDPTAVSARGG